MKVLIVFTQFGIPDRAEDEDTVVAFNYPLEESVEIQLFLFQV